MAFKYEQTAKDVRQEHERKYSGHQVEVKRVGGRWFDTVCSHCGSLTKRKSRRPSSRVARAAAREMGVPTSEVTSTLPSTFFSDRRSEGRRT